MTIACTRCGATCEGDIIVPPLAFGFKHEKGCGHGVGPLAVLPASFKRKPQKEEIKVEETVKPTDHVIFDEVKEIKVEETVKPQQSEKKTKRNSQKD